MKATIRPVLLAGLGLFAGAAFAQPKEFKPPVAQVAPSLDKVLMESFVSEPATIPPGAAQITLRVTVKNVTNTGGAAGFVLNGLKLKIFRTNPQPDVLELESLVNNLTPGTSQTFGARVNIAPGARDYFARVDTEDTLHEPIVQRANNERRLKLSIPQASGQQAPAPGSATPKETKLLDFETAKRAGAQFTAGVEGPQGTCAWTGVFDAKLRGWWGPSGIPTGVVFSISCFPLTGVRATSEAFGGFRLKNGWKVKSFDFGGIRKDSSDWTWRRPPALGSDDPSMVMHIWANTGGNLLVPVSVTIEGPAGTNPYE